MKSLTRGDGGNTKGKIKKKKKVKTNDLEQVATLKQILILLWLLGLS